MINSTYELKSLNVNMQQFMDLFSTNRFVCETRGRRGKIENIEFVFFDTKNKKLLNSNRYLMLKSISNKDDSITPYRTWLIYGDEKGNKQMIALDNETLCLPFTDSLDVISDYLQEIKGLSLTKKDLYPVMEGNITKHTWFYDYVTLRGIFEGRFLKVDVGIYPITITKLDDNPVNSESFLVNMRNVTPTYSDNILNNQLASEESVAYKAFDSIMSNKLLTTEKVKGNVYSYLIRKFPEYALQNKTSQFGEN